MQSREAQMRNWQVSNELDSVTRRADRMDFQKAILTEKIEELKAETQELRTEIQDLKDEIRLMKRTRHHRHTDSDLEPDSPRKRRCHQRQSNPASPQHHV